MKTKKIKIENLDIFTPDEKIARELWDETFLPEEFNGLTFDYQYFDCGAHIGIHLLKLKQKFPDIHVTCFEPNLDNFRVLQMNAKNLNNVTLINKAISNKTGKTKLFVDSRDTRGDSISESWGKRPYKREILVETVLLSDYIQSKSWIKLDIEGEELKILNELEEKDKLRNISGFHIEIHVTNKDINKYEEIKRILLRNKFKILINKEKEFKYMLPSYLQKWHKELNPQIYTITAVKN